jgi:predicted dehydrogenase
MWPVWNCRWTAASARFRRQIVDNPIAVGIIGAGNISGQYFDTLTRLNSVKVVAVADIDQERSGREAAKRGLQSMTVERLLEHPDIEVVLNLTVPQAHAEIDLAAIESGKHVYGEKPLALSLDDGRKVMAAAQSRGLRVGTAPDTFLGTGLQTSLRALTSGQIGEPFAAAACWGSPGHELWHPNPQYFYERGAGPVFDMGPYYLTALIVHLGPVVRVQARHGTTARNRTVATGPRAGTALRREVPTFAVAILEHASGAVSTVSLSYETWATSNALLEIYGTEGTLRLPDPNWFTEPVGLWRSGHEEWINLPHDAGYRLGGRGIGLAEMACAITAGRPHLASGALGLHVLDIMTAIERVGDGGSGVILSTSAPTPYTPVGLTDQPL